MVWAAISNNGPEAIYFIEGHINGDSYQDILKECLPDIPELF